MGWFQNPALELRILVVPDLAGAHWTHARDHDNRLIRRKLHDFPGCQQRARRLLAAHHQMTKPWRKAMSGIVLHRAHLGCGSKSVRYAFGGALVIGGKRNSDVAV